MGRRSWIDRGDVGSGSEKPSMATHDCDYENLDSAVGRWPVKAEMSDIHHLVTKPGYGLAWHH